MIFLDNSATSYPKPESVSTLMDQFYRKAGVNPGRSGYDLCMEAGDLLERTGKLLARFFNGVDPNRLCFCYNATDALNLIIFGLLREGDHAITTTLEHNSVLRPLFHLSQEIGVDVDYVPFDKSGFVDPERVAQSFRSRLFFSGLLLDQVDEVMARYTSLGLYLVHRREQDGWVALELQCVDPCEGRG